MIEMIGAFTFNNISSDTFKLVCKSVKRPLLPAVKKKRVDLPRLSGVYDFDEDTEYDLRQITIRITYLGNDFYELRSRAREIAAWLGVNTWSRLIINDEPDKYWLAKVTEEISLENFIETVEAGTAEITFDCQPFAYSLEEVSFTFSVTNSITIYADFNIPGTRHINHKSPPGSKFQIKIVGSWESITMSTITGTVLRFIEPGSGTLIIDNIEMTATLNGVNKFHALTGDVDKFLTLEPGPGMFHIFGYLLKADVTLEFIPLWL